MSVQQTPHALISVYDKTGLVPFGEELQKLGYKLLATGGSCKMLREAGLDVLEVSEFTKEPELFAGRVKTLNPKVFGGILYNRSKEEDIHDSLEHQMPPIDIVAVNFYPFKKEAVEKNLSLEKAIEFVDIGGPSLLRASAKNWKHTVPVSSPADYSKLVSLLKEEALSDEERKGFAARTFKAVLDYDDMISSYFDRQNEVQSEKVSLRYGENPGQEAYLEKKSDVKVQHLHGKELSYNNILDLDSGVQLLRDFGTEPVCAILKHTNPCGLAWGEENVASLFERAFSSDPVSSFGGIILCNRKIDEAAAVKMNESFFECILAPSFSKEAFEILTKKKNRRLITLDLNEVKDELQVKSTVFGKLYQSPYPALTSSETWEHKAGPKLTEKELKEMFYALCSVKHLKSNAISFVKGGKAVGQAGGHVSRVDACSNAIVKAKSFKHELEGSFMASDAFFPFKDCVELAAAEGVKGICQPGGSVRDEESIAACEEKDISLYFCHQRYFKH